MAAPAGVNEELPQEPVKAEVASAQVTEPAEVIETAGAAGAAGAASAAGAAPVEEEAAEVPPEAPADVMAEAPADVTPEAPPEGAEAGPGEAADREEKRDVGPLAIAGIIFAIIALVGIAVGVLAILTHGFRPKTVVTYRPAAVFGLRPGQCVDSAGNGINVTVVSCGTPHDSEVFATYRLTGSSWPGSTTVQQNASDGCASRFSGYLNPQLATADLTQGFVYPNREAWQAGERTIICEVSSSSGQLTGSVGKGG